MLYIEDATEFCAYIKASKQRARNIFLIKTKFLDLFFLELSGRSWGTGGVLRAAELIKSNHVQICRNHIVMYHTTAITQLFVVSQNTHTDQEAAYICWLPACQHSIHKVDFYPLFSQVVHFFLFLVTGMFKIWGKGEGREYGTSIPLGNQARNSTCLCDNELELLF